MANYEKIDLTDICGPKKEIRLRDDSIRGLLQKVIDLKDTINFGIRAAYLNEHHPDGANDPYFDRFDEIIEEVNDVLTKLECHLSDELFENTCIPY